MRWYNVSGASGKLLEAQFTTYQEDRASYLQVRRCCKYQERLACYLAKMLQHIRNIFQVTWRKVYNVSGRSCKLMTSRKMLQVSGTSCMLLDKDVTTYFRNIIQVTWRRCDNVSGTSCKLLAEDFTTHQERVASYMKKMLQEQGHVASYLRMMFQRIRNALHVTWRRCYNIYHIRNIFQVSWRRCDNVPGKSCKLLAEHFTAYQERVASH